MTDVAKYANYEDFETDLSDIRWLIKLAAASARSIKNGLRTLDRIEENFSRLASRKGLIDSIEASIMEDFQNACYERDLAQDVIRYLASELAEDQDQGARVKEIIADAYAHLRIKQIGVQ